MTDKKNKETIKIKKTTFIIAIIVILAIIASLATVYYTLDGSEPDESSEIYFNSIKLNETSVVRARS